MAKIARPDRPGPLLSGLPMDLTLHRHDLLWIIVGTLLTGVFALVAYDQLFGLHFSAWQLYTETPSTEPLAKALRGPVTGWYRPVTVALTMLAGLVGVFRALHGRWRPLATLVALTLVTIVGIEVTQSAGQRRTPTSEVDSVAMISVVWTVMLGLLPLVIGLVALSGILSGRDAAR